MKIYFISGTDTGVGKTLASALFCRFFMNQGLKTAYVKPVQTGDVSDAAFVQHICGTDLKVYTARHYKLPASPHLSAPQEGKHVCIRELVDDINRFTREFTPEILIVEGAGGLSVPFNETETMADLCNKLKAELFIVSRAGLGTLNHTFLTIHYAESSGLTPAVIVSGCSSNPDIIEQDNIKQISKMSDGRLSACIPRMDGLDTEHPAAVDLDLIFKVDF